ncbi:MAG: hypothetical protein JNN09_09230 [Alphaproteobacteria bacterium]|nr:hypothetical protein [Alphaproteobacteria bacterium]
MTVTVETPEGLKTGYAVREVHQYTDIKIGDAGGGMAGAIGEAVVVDLGQRGKLFMTIGEDHYFIFEAFPLGGGENTPRGIKYYSHLKNAKASLLDLKTVPQLVTFTDVNNPLTVKAVELHNLAASFGEGVKLQDITVETTDEPMTTGIIEATLPWLKNIKSNIDGSNITTGSSYANTLHVGYFKRGH